MRFKKEVILIIIIIIGIIILEVVTNYMSDKAVKEVTIEVD